MRGNDEIQAQRRRIVKGQEHFFKGWAFSRERARGSRPGLSKAIRENARTREFLRILGGPEVCSVLPNRCWRRRNIAVRSCSAGCRFLLSGSVRGSNGAGSSHKAGVVNQRRWRP